jgi:hypothetical protein
MSADTDSNTDGRLEITETLGRQPRMTGEGAAKLLCRDWRRPGRDLGVITASDQQALAKVIATPASHYDDVKLSGDDFLSSN